MKKIDKKVVGLVSGMVVAALTLPVEAAEHPVSKGKRLGEFGELLQDYTNFKDELQNKLGFDYGVTVSYMGQYGAPNGKKAAFQTIIYPDFTWTFFDNDKGNLELNAAYNVVRYAGSTANGIANRMGVGTPINDYTEQSNEFPEFYLSYQFAGKYDWLTVALGQFPIYNFDGTTYNSNQQENFINWSFSQNASSTYSTAGLGGYVQVAPNDWVFSLGMQDATNIDGENISTSQLGEKHFTTFGSIAYNPNIKGLGEGQYSVLFYNQPWVKNQPETTNGWSVNALQNLNDKWAIFGRVNGVTGDQADIDLSYMMGLVYNNPWDRNELDQIGVALGVNHLNEDAVGEDLAHTYEGVFESYVNLGVSKWMMITPDIQVYFNPADNQKSNNAFAFSLRATVFF